MRKKVSPERPCRSAVNSKYSTNLLAWSGRTSANPSAAVAAPAERVRRHSTAPAMASAAYAARERRASVVVMGSTAAYRVSLNRPGFSGDSRV